MANNNKLMNTTKEIVYLYQENNSPDALPKKYPSFQPFIYSVDTFFPFVDLHQEKYWMPDKTKAQGTQVSCWLWVHICLGWIFSTLAAISLTGLVRKE